MRIEKQVCTMKQAEMLKALGVSQDSIFSWCGDKNHIPKDHNPERKAWAWVGLTKPANSMEEDHRANVPSAKPFAAAYTSAELGQKLSDDLFLYREEDVFYCGPNSNTGIGEMAGMTEAEAKAWELISRIETGALKLQRANELLNE